MTDPIEPPDPDLDDLQLADLAELDGPAYDTACVLGAWLARHRGILYSAHNVGTFLDLLAEKGWRVTRIKASDIGSLLPPPKE